MNQIKIGIKIKIIDTHKECKYYPLSPPPPEKNKINFEIRMKI